jgi:hypothetical protein
VIPSVDEVLDRLGRPARAYVSRYLDPGLRTGLEEVMQVEEVPGVRGRAIVQPSVVGRFDGIHPAVACTAIVDDALAADPPIGCSDVGQVGDSGAIGQATARARRLAKRLNQIPRISSAHGEPETPVFVVLLPIDPQDLTLGPGTSSLHGRFAELPGAIRIDAGRIADDDVVPYAAGLEGELKARMDGHQR